MRLRWRRLVAGLVFTFLVLQLAALALFNPSDPASDSPVDVEKRSDVPKADSPKIKEIIDNQPEQPPSPEPADAQLSGRCEITHKDTISALSRATTNVCKNRIEEVYCSHKDQLLLPKAIERTCSHETTYIANGADIVEKDYIPKSEICCKSINRSDYLYRELQAITSAYPNAEVAPWREAPIWGGTSLLTTIMKGLVDLLNVKHEWDFFINLSFADLPVKTNEHLVQFLHKHRDKNFMKSHGREADKFIKKQGLNRVFLECENHMWRLGDRDLPSGVTIDGGSDWIALNHKFVEYLVRSDDLQLEQFKLWFNYTLLPAESFFHTVVQNTHFCESFVDNNLRMTNWNRARGCKCQYKHIVDWCGCSPNDFMVSDLARLKTARPIFFARKFEEFVSQEAVNRIDNEVYGAYPDGTPSIHSYWENIWNHADVKTIADSKPDWSYDAKLTHFTSWQRESVRKIVAKLGNKFHTVLRDVSIFQEERDQIKRKFGYVMSFLSTVPCPQTDCPSFEWESFITTSPRQEVATEEAEIVVDVSIGSNWDVKELVFRDPGGIIGSFSNVHASFRFKNVQKKFHAVAVVQDPSGYPADQLDMEIPEDESVRAKRPKSSTYHCEGKLGQEVVAAEKLALRQPLRPGVWTVSLYIRQSRTTQYIPGSRTEFIVTPLNYAYGKLITKNAHTVNRGILQNDELNDKNKDLKAWTKLIPGASGNANFLTGLERNSSFLAAELEEWIDTVSQCGWRIESTCGSEKVGTFNDRCENAYWSSNYPDPKSELTPVNEHGRIR